MVHVDTFEHLTGEQGKRTWDAFLDRIAYQDPAFARVFKHCIAAFEESGGCGHDIGSRGLLVLIVAWEELRGFTLSALQQAAPLLFGDYEPATHARIPTSENEAAAMALLGTTYLEQHAPHRLRLPGIIAKWEVIAQERPSDNMTYHAPTIQAILKDLKGEA